MDTPTFKITEGEDAQAAEYTCTDEDEASRHPDAATEGRERGGLRSRGRSLLRRHHEAIEDSADRVFVNNFFGTVVTGDHDDDGYNDLIIGGRFSDISAFGTEAWLSEWWDLD